MKPGQLLTKWWQDYVVGRLRTPQAICEAAARENPDAAYPGDRFLKTPEDNVLWDAPERLKAPGWFTSAGHLKQSERANWAHADPRLMYWAAHFVEQARRRGVPLYVHSCLRGEAEQNALVKSGNSKAPYPTSAHNIGEAVDIVHGVFHWSMTKDEWDLLHVLGRLSLDRVNAQLPTGRKLALTWGGYWKFYDPAHWEITDYKQRTRKLPAVAPVHYTPRYILSAFRP